jgi:tetratricopeptide (TPR) repeat protein
MVQTLLSLGRLKEANRLLDDIKEVLDRSSDNRRGELDPDVAIHSYAVYWRHVSTLCTLRRLFFARRPEGSGQLDRRDLLSAALTASGECQKYSENLRRVSNRYGEGDEIGIAVALLKKAQALYVAGEFEEALKSVRDGAARLAGYPDNRWWRMTCLDYAAKTLACLGRIEEAKIELEKAKGIWKDSEKDDIIRRCELSFTEGLIAFSGNDIETAIQLFRESVQFEETSPCIKGAHLEKLGEALLRNHDTERAEAVMLSLKEIDIQWWDRITLPPALAAPLARRPSAASDRSCSDCSSTAAAAGCRGRRRPLLRRVGYDRSPIQGATRFSRNPI